jgi:hypothetical protein
MRKATREVEQNNARKSGRMKASIGQIVENRGVKAQFIILLFQIAPSSGKNHYFIFQP